tara:strand:+ start:241 stop:486 length:246 start_codon:yes stop_codon:yes gene_type:complete
LNGLHKPFSLRFTFYKSLSIPNIENASATKKGNSDGTIGSKSKIKMMKSYTNNKKEVEQKLKNKKEESVLDIQSKSILKPF